MQGRIPRPTHITGRLLKKPLAWIGLSGMACAAIAILGTTPAQAEAYPPSTSSCQYSNSVTPPNSSFVVGVTPGSTISISCAAGSFPDSSLLAVIEASGLAGIVSPASAELNEVDLGALSLVTTGSDGSLNATFTVPATFSAPDSNAVCPATQAQINVGLGCDLVIANLSATALNEAQIAYQGQGRPNNPTLHVSISSFSRGVETLTASDDLGACPTPVTATSRCWWGAPVTGAPNATAFSGIPGLDSLAGRHIAENTLQVSPAIYCQAGATAAACAGLPEGTLIPPALSGTITARRGAGPIVVDEPNTTPYRGRGFLPPLVPGTRNVEAVQFFVHH
jgi:hypothetical protein